MVEELIWWTRVVQWSERTTAIFLCVVTSSSGLLPWEYSSLKCMQGLWSLILLSVCIVATMDKVCAYHLEGMNLWHLGWFTWLVCILLVTTSTLTRLEMNHKLPDSICDNLVGDYVITNWMHTTHTNQTFCHKNHPRCHKFIPSWGQLQTSLMVVSMWSESKMKFGIPCIPCKGEGFHDESHDDDAMHQRKRKNLPINFINLFTMTYLTSDGPSPKSIDQFIIRHEWMPLSN